MATPTPHQLKRGKYICNDIGRMNFAAMQWLMHLTCLLAHKDFGFLKMSGFWALTTASNGFDDTFTHLRFANA
jgi:hypothetical protein